MRVLVTRPQADAERTARALAARGHEAVLAPVLRIVRTDEQPPSAAFDAIILTSANAVPALASLGASAEGLPVFAVGERTAVAAAEAGCRDVRPASGDAASLTRLVLQTASPGAKLLHVAGLDRKPEPQATLSAVGFDVVVWAAYEAAAADRLPEAGLHAVRERRLDAALHYSRRSAGVVLDLVNDAGLMAEFRALPHVCLSADAAAPLQAAGARRVTIAARPDETSLLTALDGCAEKYGQVGSRATHSGC
jgi:uroporphyrinogen-III synthase